MKKNISVLNSTFETFANMSASEVGCSYKEFLGKTRYQVSNSHVWDAWADLTINIPGTSVLLYAAAIQSGDLTLPRNEYQVELTWKDLDI